MPGPLEVMDSSVRFAASLETRPDLVLRTPNAASKWTITFGDTSRGWSSRHAGMLLLSSSRRNRFARQLVEDVKRDKRQVFCGEHLGIET